MILQSLHDYYQRKSADSESAIPPEGFEWKGIPFVVVIDRAGEFIALEDTREGEGTKKTAKKFLVPKGTQRSGSKSYQTVNLLWDHVGYVLGQPRTLEAKDVKLAQKQHDAWLAMLRNLPQPIRSSAVDPILRFYGGDGVARLKETPNWADCERTVGANLAFRIDGETTITPCADAVTRHVNLHAQLTGDGDNSAPSEDRSARCLVTGEFAPIARTHTKTPISKDSKSLVSFQRSSGYDSYGKEQAFNAPVSKIAEFRYTTALKQLLNQPRNRVLLGGVTILFWSEYANALEDSFSAFFERVRKDDPDQEAAHVRALYESVHTGAAIVDSATRFYVLGLAPNSNRICVRFWQPGSVADISRTLRQHFADMEVAHGADGPKAFGVGRILRELAPRPDRDTDDVPPNIAADTMRAILQGSPYPLTLLQHVLRRIRAEQVAQHRNDQNVTHARAAILKATLNRFHRIHPTNEKEITVALDITNDNPGYRLGRLFAVLEKIQEDAQPGINATIRDRFYGAASASPVTVFPRLLKLAHHHQSKIKSEKPGFAVNNEKWLSEIIGGIPTSMPAQLAMEDQARFAIGYYHQRQALFTKSTASDSDSSPKETP